MLDRLRRLAAELDRIARESPDITGAVERGVLSSGEYGKAMEASLIRQEREHAVLDRIRELAGAESGAFDAVFDTLLRWLAVLHERLEPGEGDFEVRVVRNLLPTLKETLEQWRTGGIPAHSPAWAWRFVFGRLDEAEALAARLNPETTINPAGGSGIP